MTEEKTTEKTKVISNFPPASDEPTKVISSYPAGPTEEPDANAGVKKEDEEGEEPAYETDVEPEAAPDA
jgi:hypothetical protein